MNIVVVNGYVRQNKGDAALLSVLCHELQGAFPHATLKISSQENPLEEPRFENWQNVGSFNRYCFDPGIGKLGHLLRLLLCVGAVTVLSHAPSKLCGTFISLLPRALRIQFTTLSRADLVVAMGGGYLNGDASLMAQVAIYLMLAPLKLAKHFGACAVCAPQSMGPFATKFQRKIVTRTLEKIDLILTREQKTVQLLDELSDYFPIVPSIDSGFLFNTDQIAGLRHQLRIKPQQLLVGVTVRHWLDPKRQREYERSIAKTIDHIVSQHQATVVLIPQVTSSLGGDDDRIVSKRVYGEAKHKRHVHVLKRDYTHQQIKALYNELDLIIGTRFHSVIFSLTSLVPALAIEYEHKTSGIMHDLGLDDWVVKIEEATAEVLIPKIDELIAAKKQYKQHLSKVLPPYIARAQQATAFIKEVYGYSA
jgi:colanic acid/amylovoran biosynthesis protein